MPCVCSILICPCCCAPDFRRGRPSAPSSAAAPQVSSPNRSKRTSCSAPSAPLWIALALRLAPKKSASLQDDDLLQRSVRAASSQAINSRGYRNTVLQRPLAEPRPHFGNIRHHVAH